MRPARDSVVWALALGSAPAYAAYSVTRHDGAVSVSVYRASGVAGANAALHKMHARVVVVPVRPGCPSIGSLPRPQPAPHPAVWVSTGVNAQGHRSVSVKIKGSIPAGDTMILAFSGNPHSGSVGAGGIDHRVRAPLREPPICAVRRQRLRPGQHRGPIGCYAVEDGQLCADSPAERLGLGGRGAVVEQAGYGQAGAGADQ